MSDAEQAPEAEGFGAAVARWRTRRRMTQQALANAMGFDRSYVSQVEAGRHPASADFARKAESILNAGGELWAAWQAAGNTPGEQPAPVTARGSGGLIVELDHAELEDQAVYEWSTADPPLNARYRLEWRFKGRNEQPDPRPDLRLASDRMRAAGIVQQSDPILASVARPFDLPAEAGEAGRLVDELLAAMQRVREHHVFGKGMGLAAPQIGVSRAAAIVQPPNDDATPITLFNPRVISESNDSDEQYEGCLSFFDVRGLVPRPLRLEVEHTTLEGRRVITVFTDGLARLIAHEIDHLYGRLYLDRIREGIEPISVEEYRGTGQPWGYDKKAPAQ